MERKAVSGTMLTLLFLSMLTLAFFSAVETSEYGGYEVKFRGTAISDGKWGEIVAYGSYYCEVTVLGILYDPNSTLSLNDNVTIAYQDSLSLHIGDEVECYGTNCINCTTCPKQYYGYIVCKPTPYYVIRYPHKLLLETDKPIYKLGENVTITLTNISNETIEIGGYPAWQIFTYPEEDPVFPSIFAFLAWSLDSGESDSFAWNQYDEFTQSPATPGKYVVKDTQGWGLHACFDIVPAEGWVPYVPLPEMVDLVFWTKNQLAYINVTLTFADAGYAVSDWGAVTQDGGEIWVDSKIWDWTGPAVLVITTYHHIYDLGYLAKGRYTFTFKAWGFPVKSISFNIKQATVAATLDVDPATLNLMSTGEWITAYIELPNEYDVSVIDVSSILLNDVISVDAAAPTQVGDYDGDGVPDLMVKFDRTQLESYIYNVLGIKYGSVTLKVAGQLMGGTPFEGSDTITVIFSGDINNDGTVDVFDAVALSNVYGTRQGDLAYNIEADLDLDGTIDVYDATIMATNYGATVP